MTGIIGQFFQSFGITVALAIGVSYVVVMTVIPMVSSLIVSPKQSAFYYWSEPFFVAMQNAYARTLKVVMNQKILVTILVVAVFMGSIFVLSKLGMEFMLKEDRSQVYFWIEAPTDISIYEMRKKTEALEKNTKALNKHAQAVEHFGFTDFIAERADRWGSKFFSEIAHLQEKRARVSAWNLTRPQQKQWNKQVRELLANNQLITEADAESMMMAAASSIGHYDPHIVGKTVARATKYAQMEKAMGYNKSEIDDIAKNYYGVAEARQVANDVEKTLKTFETVFRITTTSSGKITVADVETILRNLGPGAATLSDEGLLRLLAYAEQIKVAGRGQSGSTGAGISTVGTTTKMLQLMAMGKPSALGAKR